MKKFYKIFFVFVIITIIFGTIYVAGQQVLRQSANDPQIQMAEDTATALASGSSAPADFMPASRQPFDITKSLAPFTIIFDSGGVILESSGDLNGENFSFPMGVFDYAKANGEDRFTWQPEVGQRFAVVLKYYAVGGKSGFVLVGRSLREVEIREDNLELLVGFGWLFSAVLILIFAFWYNMKYGKQ